MGFTTTRVLDGEDIKIPPEELIESALYYLSREEYDIAEQDFITARINSMGTSKELNVGKQVKKHLVVLYIKWADSSVENYDFAIGEYVLKKLEGIHSNKKFVQKKRRDLYEIWGDALKAERKIPSAENRYLKALFLEIKLNPNEFYNSVLITKIKDIKFLYNAKKHQKNGEKLYVISRGKSFSTNYKILLFIGLLCLVSSLSYLGVIVFNYNFSWFPFICVIIVFASPIIIINHFEIETEKHKIRQEGYKNAPYFIFCAIQILLFFSIWDVNEIIIPLNAFVLSSLLIIKSVKMASFYKSVEKNKLKIIYNLIKNRYSDQKLDFKVETPPPPSQADANLDYAVGRAGFHAGRFVAGQIFRNLRF